jgi:hypothetical protein
LRGPQSWQTENQRLLVDCNRANATCIKQESSQEEQYLIRVCLHGRLGMQLKNILGAWHIWRLERDGTVSTRSGKSAPAGIETLLNKRVAADQ